MIASIVAGILLATPQGASWQSELEREMPLLGHRNWIVVADSAYPAQNSPGIRTIVTHSSQAVVLKAVLAELRKARHVRPLVRVDRELSFLTEADAPGVTAFRKRLAASLGGRPTSTALHEKIIKDLDEAGKTFRVLLLKTDSTIPYTSVFLQLDCAYWSGPKETQLRKVMAGAKP